ncbi:hypothetical protein SCHPADRAFT_1001440 [Schizopora paradoxa]|uniref:BTB domain-containing protein n=1 Tax=Schizopora paradoxa TaxID=27342 RepID=A0A0H2RDX0_9AGAM|nr:hypothetical protein SCHPADRAFT_1001440 [Schizopora paradoxa]
MTPPPSKRARTSSTSGDTNRMEFEELTKLKRRENMWFEDGNIVLATDVHLYCVHRGVLARNSTFFKEMLELPNVGNTSNSEVGSIENGDSWEGKPLVRMVGDRDEDVYHILMALYDVRFYSAHKPTTLPVFLSLIRMGTKYNFSHILDEISLHIKLAYPTDLDSMVERTYEELFVCYDNNNDFQLLLVAEQCDMKILLPMLYFDCADSSLSTILEESKDLDLPNSILLKILRGYEKISRYATQRGIRSFSPHRKCTLSCQTARMELFANYTENPPYFSVHDLLQRNPIKVDKNLRLSVCENCEKASFDASEDLRLEIWNAIPSMFELGSWEDYRSE